MGRAVKVLVRITQFIRTITDLVKQARKRCRGERGRPGNSDGRDRTHGIIA